MRQHKSEFNKITDARKSVADTYAILETSFRRNMANVGFLTTLPRFGVEIILALSLGFVLVINSSPGNLNLMDLLYLGMLHCVLFQWFNKVTTASHLHQATQC